MLDFIRNLFDDFPVPAIVTSVVVGLLLYTAVATFSYSYLVDNEKQDAYNLCVSNRLELMVQNPVKSYAKCSKYRFGIDGAEMSAAGWPISVPIVFAMRHPIGIMLTTGTGLLGLFGAVTGHSAVRARRKRQKIALEAADRLIREEAPDLLT